MPDNPDTHSLYDSALKALRAKDRHQAERYARAAIALDPHHLKSLLLLARLSNVPAEKTSLYQRVKKIDPQNAIALAYFEGIKGAHAAPSTVKRPPLYLRWVLCLAVVGSLGLGLIWMSGLGLNTPPMPTLAVVMTLTLTPVEQVTRETSSAVLSSERSGDAVSANNVSSSSRVTPGITVTVSRRITPGPVQATSSTQVMFNVAPDSSEAVSMHTSTAFDAAVIMPSATSVPFDVVPLQPTNTQVLFNLATATQPPPSPTSTRELPTATIEGFVPEPTSTTLPSYMTATPPSLPDFRTPLPPTDTYFSESPLSGGQMITPIIPAK